MILCEKNNVVKLCLHFHLERGWFLLSHKIKPLTVSTTWNFNFFSKKLYIYHLLQ